MKRQRNGSKRPFHPREMPDKAVLSTGYCSFPNAKAHNDEVHAPFVLHFDGPAF
jgi:hypothetical protein